MTTIAMPRTARAYRPDHFTAEARPRAAPAARIQGRRQIVGPAIASVLARIRATVPVRSSSTNQNASSTNSASDESSSAMRLIATASGSIAMSAPATVASHRDPVSRFATTYSSGTRSVPTSAVAMRHPNGPVPKSAMPTPMIHLPSGGCATNDPVSVYPFTSPASNAAFGSSPHVPS